MNCWLNTVTFIGMSTIAMFMRVTSAELADWLGAIPRASLSL